MTDEELMQKIEEAITNYSGDTTYLEEAIGMVIVGRLVGWEYERLATRRAVWAFATQLLGDPKLLMPKRGRLAGKAKILDVVDGLAGGYLAVVKRKVSLPMEYRRKFGVAT